MKAPNEVLLDVADRGARDLDGGDDALQAAADERDVGRLDRDVGAGPDREADVGLGQRRGVVDAVADHRHALALELELLDLVGLVLGQHLGEHAVDADLRVRSPRRWRGCRR